ncbi:MAG TPA: alpha-L-fucosidase [Chloroflexota bacterium]|nr:alpha-L-fucosidase [Chloroflexota bacterium]
MSAATTPQPGPTAGDSSWFVQARFGLFVHWGIYALPARHEWVKSRERIADAEYQRYFEHFDPDLYNPTQWARDAKAAGMRYAVLTTKHHDGFCLWDSALTDYKATNTPARRDLVREFVDAFRSEGLRIGFYHSLIDWHHDQFPLDVFHPQRDDTAAREQGKRRDVGKYAQYLHGQVRELLTDYGRIDVMWLDFSYPRRDYAGMPGKGRGDWRSEELVAMIRRLQPDILIDNRADVPGDFHTPEQVQPNAWIEVDGQPVVWEACQTLNGSWGYDRDNLDWKPPDLLVRMLVDTVSKGGNLLLNVGPTARGEFDPRARATLAAIGDWTRLHGRSIYRATASAFAPPPDCRYTQHGDRLYLHLFAWPFKHVYLEGLGGRIAYAQLLNDASELGVIDAGGELGHASIAERRVPASDAVLVLPVQRPDALVPVVELFLK